MQQRSRSGLGAVCMLGGAAVVGLGGCTAEVDSERVTRTDSAGVVIVTNLEAPEVVWTLDADPLLDLGTVEGGGPEQFFRVSAVRRLPDGRIAVMDATREVRLFDPDGTFAGSFGGEGDGPGEYRGPTRLFVLSGDSLAIWDTRLRRLTVVGTDGGVGRVVSPEGVGMRPQILSVIPDGSTLFEQEVLLGYTPSEYTLTYSDFILYGPEGTAPDTLGRHEDVEVGLWGEGPLAGPRLFDEGMQFAGDADGYWIGTTRTEDIRHYSLSGELERVVRWPGEDRSIEDDAVARSLDEALADLGPGGDAEMLRTFHLSRGVPERYPSHGPALVDSRGWLWLQTYERPGHQGPSMWRVFDAEGVWRASVEAPAGHRVLDIGDDYVLGVGLDAFDVEHVRMFGLERSGG